MSKMWTFDRILVFYFELCFILILDIDFEFEIFILARFLLSYFSLAYFHTCIIILFLYLPAYLSVTYLSK